MAPSTASATYRDETAWWSVRLSFLVPSCVSNARSASLPNAFTCQDLNNGHPYGLARPGQHDLAPRNFTVTTLTQECVRQMWMTTSPERSDSTYERTPRKAKAQCLTAATVPGTQR